MKKEHAKLIANQGGNANGMINATFQKSKKTLTILCGDPDVEIEHPQLDEAVAQVEITQEVNRKIYILLFFFFEHFWLKSMVIL